MRWHHERRIRRRCLLFDHAAPLTYGNRDLAPGLAQMVVDVDGGELCQWKRSIDNQPQLAVFAQHVQLLDALILLVRRAFELAVNNILAKTEVGFSAATTRPMRGE